MDFRLLPALKVVATVIVGFLAGGSRGPQTEAQSGLSLVEPSLPGGSQPFQSSYLMFAEALQSPWTVSVYEPEPVASAGLPMPILGDCPSPEVRYELTRDIQAKHEQLEALNKPLVEAGEAKHRQIREAYHDANTHSIFDKLLSTNYRNYEARSFGVRENSDIRAINKKIQENKGHTEEEVSQLRQAAGC